jgi:CRISPR-associated protein Cmr6
MARREVLTMLPAQREQRAQQGPPPPDDTMLLDGSTNLALWLDRFSWGFDQQIARDHVGKTLSKVRVPEGYQEAFERRKRLLKSLKGGYEGGETRLYTVTLSGRAILGIGMASVRETNLSLLRPWGLPYLAGSSLKGLASHTAHHLGGADWARPPKSGEKAGILQRALFGDVTGAGAVVFHDAWWIPQGDKPPVHPDTMTVHHANYYSGRDSAPADWEEPNPVSFLTISGSYLLALSGPPEALDLVEKILTEGLASLGVGAKTAAGYGRASIERMTSALVRTMDGYQRPTAQPNNVEHLTREFLRAVQEASAPDEIAAAERAARRMQQAAPRVWKEWLQKDRCPPEAHRWFAPQPEPATPPSAAPPQPSTTPAPAAPPAEEQAAHAWIADDRSKRPTLFVLLAGARRPLEEEVRKVKTPLDEATQAALKAASKDTPAPVLVSLKDGKRVQSVRTVKQP